MTAKRRSVVSLLLPALILGSSLSLAQSRDYYMRVEVDTSSMRGDPQVISDIRSAGGVYIPSNPIDIPLNQHQTATFRKDRNETYLSAVNMMNQVTIKFAGANPGEFVIPANPTNSPKVRIFLADMQPILDGDLVSGKIIVSDYVPGDFIQGSFVGEEKVAGHDLYFSIRGHFRLPSTVR